MTCTVIGMWLVVYVTKQVLIGREQFAGAESQYWRYHLPAFLTYMALATTTIILGVYNLCIGLRRVRYAKGSDQLGAAEKVLLLSEI